MRSWGGRRDGVDALSASIDTDRRRASTGGAAARRRHLRPRLAASPTVVAPLGAIEISPFLRLLASFERAVAGFSPTGRRCPRTSDDLIFLRPRNLLEAGTAKYRLFVDFRRGISRHIRVND